MVTSRERSFLAMPSLRQLGWSHLLNFRDVMLRQRDSKRTLTNLCLLLQPTPTQLSFMQALHTTLSSSPDPALLEIRILTNHGSDERFSFLRKGGKFRDIWEGIRSGADLGVGVADEKVEEKSNGTGLVAYDGSGSDSDLGDDVEASNDSSTATATTPTSITLKPPTQLDKMIPLIIEGAEIVEPEEEVEEAERKRLIKLEKAKEWARKRKEARDLA